MVQKPAKKEPTPTGLQMHDVISQVHVSSQRRVAFDGVTPIGRFVVVLVSIQVVGPCALLLPAPGPSSLHCIQN